MGVGLDHDVGTRLLGIGDNFQRRAFCDVLALRAFPTRHRYGKQIRKTEQKSGLVGQEPMLEQPEQFLLGLDAVDIVEIFQRRLGGPAQEHRRKNIGRRPLQNLRDFRPDLLLLDARFQGVDAGDDQPVELLVFDFAERAIEFANVLSRRIRGFAPRADPAHIAVGGYETQIDLQRRIAEP